MSTFWTILNLLAIAVYSYYGGRGYRFWKETTGETRKIFGWILIFYATFVIDFIVRLH